MRRNTALFLSGVVTAFVMVVVIGLIALSGQFGQEAQAATLSNNTSGEAASLQASDPGKTTDVATLQAEANAYKQALQKADNDLQNAYNQVKSLNDQVNQLTQQIQNAQVNQDSSGQGFFGGQSGFGERRFRRGGGNFNPFAQPLPGGGDD